MLDKSTTIDRVEVLPEMGNVQVRQRIDIVEDGAVISSTYHRYVLERGADIAAQPEEVKAIAEAAWEALK